MFIIIISLIWILLLFFFFRKTEEDRAWLSAVPNVPWLKRHPLLLPPPTMRTRSPCLAKSLQKTWQSKKVERFEKRNDLIRSLTQMEEVNLRKMEEVTMTKWASAATRMAHIEWPPASAPALEKSLTEKIARSLELALVVNLRKVHENQNYPEY